MTMRAWIGCLVGVAVRALIKKLDDPVERNDAIEQLAYLKERGRGAIPRNMRPKLIR
jgi:hypothetical protein